MCHNSRVHRPPSFLIYYPAWTFLGGGLWCLILTPFQRTWQPLVFGIACLSFAIPFMALAAWWRDRYNEWHPEDGGLVDDMGFPVARTELASDAFATWVVNLVWPQFRSKTHP